MINLSTSKVKSYIVGFFFVCFKCGFVRSLSQVMGRVEFLQVWLTRLHNLCASPNPGTFKPVYVIAFILKSLLVLQCLHFWPMIVILEYHHILLWAFLQIAIDCGHVFIIESIKETRKSFRFTFVGGCLMDNHTTHATCPFSI